MIAASAHASLVAAAAEDAVASLLSREASLINEIVKSNRFSRAEARRAAHGALAPLRSNDLERLWRRQFALGRHDLDVAPFPECSVVFGGGSIPQPNIRSLIGAAMISSRVIFRPSSRDRALPRIFAAELDKRLGDRIEFIIESWNHSDESRTREVLQQADSFTMYGDSATADYLLPMLRPECQRFVYGPRLSFAVLDLNVLPSLAAIRRIIDEFTEDVVAYDQLGCLSPAALYLIGGDSGLRLRILRTLHESLMKRAAEHGFAPEINPSAAMKIHSLRAAWTMDGSGRRMIFTNGAMPGWTLLYDETDARLRETPGYQTLFVLPVPDWEAVRLGVRDRVGEKWELQCAGVGPSVEAIPKEIALNLRGNGLSRICPLGSMQSPPLDWLHDGHPFFPWRI